MHLKIDSHFSLLPAHILLKSCKDDEVFSVSIIDVCGLTARVRVAPLRSALRVWVPALGIPAAPWNEAEWGARHPYGRP
jgi:hypothetical protein